MPDDIASLTREIRAFADARGWLRDGNENMRGLAISISLEASELLEHFQWVRDEDIPARLDAHGEDVRDELADVVIYALQFADRAGFDLADAIREKMRKNAEKYPAA